MERCTLTQRPCRKAIAEVVEANKNRYFLQRTYEVAKIFWKVAENQLYMRCLTKTETDSF